MHYLVDWAPSLSLAELTVQDNEGKGINLSVTSFVPIFIVENARLIRWFHFLFIKWIHNRRRSNAQTHSSFVLVSLERDQRIRTQRNLCRRSYNVNYFTIHLLMLLPRKQKERQHRMVGKYNDVTNSWLQRLHTNNHSSFFSIPCKDGCLLFECLFRFPGWGYNTWTQSSAKERKT